MGSRPIALVAVVAFASACASSAVAAWPTETGPQHVVTGISRSTASAAPSGATPPR